MKSASILLVIFLYFSLQIASAATFPGYQPLVSIPGISSDSSLLTGDGNNAFGAYLSNLYNLGVTAAAGLAVIMVIWGGVEYITSVAGEGKSGGKERITSAILGLLLALGSYIILKTINEDLLSLSFDLKDAPGVNTKSTGGASGSW